MQNWIYVEQEKNLKEVLEAASIAVSWRSEKFSQLSFDSPMCIRVGAKGESAGLLEIATPWCHWLLREDCNAAYGWLRHDCVCGGLQWELTQLKHQYSDNKLQEEKHVQIDSVQDQEDLHDNRGRSKQGQWCNWPVAEPDRWPAGGDQEHSDSEAMHLTELEADVTIAQQDIVLLNLTEGEDQELGARSSGLIWWVSSWKKSCFETDKSFWSWMLQMGFQPKFIGDADDQRAWTKAFV